MPQRSGVHENQSYPYVSGENVHRRKARRKINCESAGGEKDEDFSIQHHMTDVSQSARCAVHASRQRRRAAKNP